MQPRISWRGDGDFFCVSLVNQSKSARVLKVYNREAILQNTSESVAFLEHSLAWRPSGNLIASTQKQPHRHDVVFFERNGLRHGEFTLRDTDCVVHSLEWSADSSILAISLTAADSVNTKKNGNPSKSILIFKLFNFGACAIITGIFAKKYDLKPRLKKLNGIWNLPQQSTFLTLQIS